MVEHEVLGPVQERCRARSSTSVPTTSRACSAEAPERFEEFAERFALKRPNERRVGRSCLQLSSIGCVNLIGEHIDWNERLRLADRN